MRRKEEEEKWMKISNGIFMCEFQQKFQLEILINVEMQSLNGISDLSKQLTQ